MSPPDVGAQAVRAAPLLPAPRRTRLGREAAWGYVFIAPWLMGLLVFTAGPVAAMFYFSLTDYSVLAAPHFLGLENFRRMFTADPLFWQSLLNTAVYVVLRIPIHVALALALAVGLNQPLRGIAVYRTLVYLPSIVPVVAGAAVWMWLLDSQVGVLKYLLGLAGVAMPALFASEALVKPTIVVMSLWQVGVMMMVFLAALQDVPVELHEAAAIDGASAWTRFARVTLPLLTPAVFFNVIVDLINSFQVFAYAFIITNGDPLNASLFYVLYVYRVAFQHFDMGYASALAVVLFFVIMAFTLLIVRSSRWWVHYEHG